MGSVEYQEVEENIIVVELSGKMDLDLSDSFENVLEEIMKKHKKANILVDLEDVEFIGSSALKVFIINKRKLDKEGLAFKVFNPNELCKQVLAITNFDKLIDIHDNLEEALESLKKEI